jgi:osmotically-inducible protein OsmY
MLFPLYPGTANASADYCGAGAALSAVLAYTHGLEDCQIEVEIAGGDIFINGVASSERAALEAVAIATDFAPGKVICNLQVCQPKPST